MKTIPDRQTRSLRGLVAACSLCAQSAPAAAISWTNTSGGNWSVAANWAPNQVPGDGDNAMITTAGPTALR